MTVDFLVTVIAGIGTLLAAFIVTGLARRTAIKGREDRADVEKIAKTVSAKASEARSKALEAIAEKLPSGLSAEQFELVFAQQIRVDGDIIISQEPVEDKDLIEGLVNGYHQQALSQAKVQFWFSIAAATVGFVYIIYAASQIDGTIMLSYMKVLPGVIIDAVAALFFRQAEKTRERATELYDRLRQDLQMLRAESVVGSIENLTIRSAVKAQIALHMAGLEPKEIDLLAFMSHAQGVASDR